MKKLFFLLCGVVLLLTSCLTPDELRDRKCAKAQRRYELASYKYGCPLLEVSNSEQTATVIRDTIIPVKIPGEKAKDSVRLLSSNPINIPVSVLETKFALSKVWVDNNVLFHTLEQKATEIPVTIPAAIKETTTTKAKTIRVPYPVDRPVKAPLNKFLKFFLISGFVAWGLLIVFLIYKFRGFFSLKRFLS